MNKSFSYWEKDAWLTPPDLLVVGGGIVGATSALIYKAHYPDHHVLLADKGVVPEGASTRNAGFTCIGSMSEHLADLKLTGRETVLKRIERRWKGLNLLKETMGEKAIDYNNTGGYEIFTDEKLFDTCRQNIGAMNRHLEETLGLEDVYTEKEYDGHPAIFNRVDGAIHSGKLMKELHSRLSKLGVEVWWNTEVESVDENGVTFADGFSVKPKKTLLAVNGFTSRLIDLPIKPARGYVFVTKPIKNLTWKGTFNNNAGYIYFRNVNDRLLLGGARDIDVYEETTDRFGVNPKIKQHLVEFANTTLDLPDGWEIETEWSGIMGMTVNKQSIIREVKSNLWVAAGLSGMGIAIGMQVAKEVTAKITENQS